MTEITQLLSDRTLRKRLNRLSRKQRPPRILIEGLNYAPDEIGIAKYTTELSEWLILRGYEVTVISAPPYYPSWKIPNSYRRPFYNREVLNGVNIIRSPIYVPRDPSGLKRLLHLMTFALTSFPALIWHAFTFKPDVVISIAPALFAAPGARLAAALCNAQSWLHIQDFEVDAAFELGILKGDFLQKIALFFETALLNTFKLVSTIAPPMISLLEDKGVPFEQLYLFRNWVDTDTIRPMPVSAQNEYRLQLGLGDEQILLLYSGNIARKQGLDVVVDAARMLADEPRFQFLVCGQGPGKTDAEIRADGLSNISFLPLQPMDKLCILLNAADIHLLPQRKNVSDLLLPSKLTGMLASGRPIIATALPGSGLENELDTCGICTEPGNVLAFVEAIRELSNNKEQRLKMGGNARARAENKWSKEVVLTGFERELRLIIG